MLIFSGACQDIDTYEPIGSTKFKSESINFSLSLVLIDRASSIFLKSKFIIFHFFPKGGCGTEDDDEDLADTNDSKHKTKAGDLSIKIEIGKDKDKPKTLLAGAVFKAMSAGVSGTKDGASGSGPSNPNKAKEGSSSWHKWDTERTVSTHYSVNEPLCV